MRSQAKASTAGSTDPSSVGWTERRGRLGRPFSSAFGGTRLLSGVVLVSFLAALIWAAAAPAAPEEFELRSSFGPDGTEATPFDEAGSTAVDQQSEVVYVVDLPASKLYKFDADGSPVAFGGSAPNISGNAITGLTFIPFSAGKTQVAVDSNSHKFYLTSPNSVIAFQADGEPAPFAAGLGVGTNAIGGFTELTGLAVDANGYIYASDRVAGVVKIFAPSGEEVTQFAAEKAANLAVDTGGAVYVNRHLGTVLKFTPSSFPVTPATTYTAAADPFHPVNSYTVAVDPATNDVYIAQTFTNPKIVIYDETGVPLATIAGPGEEGEVASAEGVAIHGASTRLYVANDDPSSGASQVKIFGPRIFFEGPPTIESTLASDVTAESATLHGQINPNTAETTYRFEYGLQDCSVSVCTSVPGDGPIAAGHDVVTVSPRDISGLQPGTTYHYRIVAENSFNETEGPDLNETEGPDRTFTTESIALGFELADNRAWEMVSPPNKHGGLLFGSSVGQIQAAEDGNGLAYLSFPSIEPSPEASRDNVSVLARRGEAGWRSKDISLPNSKVVPPSIGQQGEYKLFSPDLSKALLDPRGAELLSPEASERAPYLRENTEPPTYRPLVTGKEGFANVPPGTVFGGGSATVSAVTIQNATPDLDHVLLSSSVPLVEGAPNANLDRWADGQIEAVSVLPASEGGAAVGAGSGSELVSSRHAISDDGSRVFWTAGPPNKHLYLRDFEAGESVRIDVVQSGAGAGKVEPLYQGASADGRVVFFTDTQQLTEDASASGADLYRCEISPGTPLSGCELTNLTAPPPGESAEVKGVVSATSQDGSKVFFVAEGDLNAGANQLGRVAASGEPNLYLWQEGEGLRFIATLSAEDSPDWGVSHFDPTPRQSALSTALSPSGRYFAFMSERNLTDPDFPEALNLDPASGEAVQQVFRYDALADQLDCVSCVATGAAPRGVSVNFNSLVDPRRQWQDPRVAPIRVAAILPQAVTINEGGANRTIYQPRAIFDSGRVFFNAIDSLVAADSNGEWDVYQHEPTGVGDCSASSGGASIARSAAGCVSLISSGTAEEETGFLDASATGDDVFFLTPARLSVLDEDKELDVYDARVDGVPATLPPNNECLGEACQPAVIAPNDPTPASAGFKGEGNPRPKARKRCAKGKRLVRRAGKSRCVVRKQARKGKASKGRRASR